MRVVPINEAEAIIEPFWDGGSSEHPRDKLSLLDDYTITIVESARARVSQGWCSADIHIDAAAPGAPCVILERSCDIDVSGYDILRVFASLPSWARMTVAARVDGVERTVIDSVAGPDTMGEFDGPLSGRRVEAIRIAIALAENRTAYAALLWLGLSNGEAQRRLEARRSPYTADWPGLLATQPGRPVPQIGIFFGPRDLPALRRKVSAGPLKPVFEALRRQAEQDMQCDPEADIGYYVPNPDRRWVRDRDVKRKCTAGIMERLAFVGLIDDNPAMSRMAARMALSAAHCDTWCESVIGLFPGATWHHRSFTEEIYCRACALVLDWAGFCLTPHACQVIRDAIAMKGLPRIESDFKRMEYIRSMNQGIVFSSGRIIGALGLLPAHPRYAGLIDEAERDLHEMIDAYVQPDGGTLEGMAYWNYTFGTVMPLACALARYHGRTLKEYVTATLVKTGDFALAMLSTTGDGSTYLPINDAHADQHLSPGVVGAYCQISDRPEWRQLYAAAGQAEEAAGSLYHILLAPPAAPRRPAPVKVKPRFTVLPDSGEVSTVRFHTSLGAVHFHLSCGPILASHYHEDRGSFLLEAGGEALAIDRGVTSYDHPEVALIGDASRHNLIYPESADGALMHQPAGARGARLTSALSAGAGQDVVMLACDNASAWEDGLFTANLRRVFSPAPELYVIDDELALAAPMAVSFRLNSRGGMVARDGSVWVLGQRAALRVTPLNWTPGEIGIGVEGIDSHLQPVNLLRLVSHLARAHRLITAVEVVPRPDGDPALLPGAWQYDRAALAARNAGAELALAVGTKPALRVELRAGGQRILKAACTAGLWRLQQP